MPFFLRDPEESPESLERKFRVIFEERGRDASAWLRHAHALRTAARPLWDRLSDLGHIAMMLEGDRKSTRLNSSHGYISYAVFCLKKKKKNYQSTLKTTLLNANKSYTSMENVRWQ